MSKTLITEKPTITSAKPRLSFIDLFAGCGGLSLGLVRSGWRGLFAIEKSPDAFATLQHNLCGANGQYDWPDWLPQQAMTTEELLDTYQEELTQLAGSVDLIAGGPPCQGFSFAGRRNHADPRNRLTEQYIKLVDIIRPKYLLLENVKGFKTAFKDAKKPPYSEIVQETLGRLPWGGYRVYSTMLNASSFGVPQPRARFIMVAIRADLTSSDTPDPFSEISALSEDFLAKKKLKSRVTTVMDAISDLETRRQGFAESSDTKGFKEVDYKEPNKLTPFQRLMRSGVSSEHKPNSLRLARHNPTTVTRFEDVLRTCEKGKALSKEDRERFGLKKQCFTPLHPEQLSKTITTLPDDLLHYSEPRILTVRENARIQSFPDSFEFLGKYTTGGSRRREECPRYTQVGNAVPPLMAEALGSLIQKIERGHA